MYNITMNDETINIVLGALRELPFKLSEKPIADIIAQATAQLPPNPVQEQATLAPELLVESKE